MDGHQFDRLARALAGGTDRRRLLRGLAVGVAGAALTAVGRAARLATAEECGGLGQPCCSGPAVLAPIGTRPCDPGLICTTELGGGHVAVASVGSPVGEGRCVPCDEQDSLLQSHETCFRGECNGFCAGCCQGANCFPGNRDWQCGSFGEVCQVCRVDEFCFSGRCTRRSE